VSARVNEREREREREKESVCDVYGMKTDPFPTETGN